MRIHHLPDPETGATPVAPDHAETPAETIARLTAQLTAVQAELGQYKAADAQRQADEKVIAAKMALGLSRPQALAVIQRQKEHDEAEKRKADSGKAKTASVKSTIHQLN